jgi:hypothetical protein
MAGGLRHLLNGAASSAAIGCVDNAPPDGPRHGIEGCELALGLRHRLASVAYSAPLHPVIDILALNVEHGVVSYRAERRPVELERSSLPASEDADKVKVQTSSLSRQSAKPMMHGAFLPVGSTTYPSP